MNDFVNGIKSLFGGGQDTSNLDAEAAKQREQQAIATERQKQDLQNAQGTTDQQLGRATRVPRGRRLLLAATGEAGVSKTLGG